MKQLFNSPLGSWLKAFLTAVLTLIIANGSVRNLDWIHVLDAGFIAILPVMLNWLNPSYEAYGKKESNGQE